MNSAGLDRAAAILRWIARIWSGLVIAAVILIALGSETDSGPAQAMMAGDLAQLGLIGLAVSGLILGWFHEVLGGAIAIAGTLANSLALYLFRADPGLALRVLILPGAIFILPGLAYLICGRRSRCRFGRQSTTNQST